MWNRQFSSVEQKMRKLSKRASSLKPDLHVSPPHNFRNERESRLFFVLVKSYKVLFKIHEPPFQKLCERALKYFPPALTHPREKRDRKWQQHFCVLQFVHCNSNSKLSAITLEKVRNFNRTQHVTTDFTPRFKWEPQD